MALEAVRDGSDRVSDLPPGFMVRSGGSREGSLPPEYLEDPIVGVRRGGTY